MVNWIARNLDRQVFYLNNAFSKPLKVRWRGEKIFRRITDPDRYGGRGKRLFNVELPSGAHIVVSSVNAAEATIAASAVPSTRPAIISVVTSVHRLDSSAMIRASAPQYSQNATSKRSVLVPDPA